MTLSFFATFDNQVIHNISTNLSNVEKNIREATSATLTYFIKSGEVHQLAFFRCNTEECYIIDANRFIIKCGVEGGANILLHIMERSNPSTIQLISIKGNHLLNSNRIFTTRPNHNHPVNKISHDMPRAKL